MKAVRKKPPPNRGAWAVAAALEISAGLLLAPRGAEATFPGEEGRIAFASNRTAGEGVDNPTGDYEIFTIRPDGTDLSQLTHNHP